MKFFKKKRNIVISIIILLILISIICGKRKKTIIVQTKKIEIGPINEYIRTDGTLEPFVDIEISSDIMGKCEKIFVKEGDKIKKGSKLLKIDNTNQQARLKEAISSLKLAETNYEYKKFIYENNRQLYDDSLISYSEYNIALLDYKNAKSQLSSAQAALEIAKDNLNKTIIESPINGIVSAIYVEEGENVITGTMNNIGTVLMTVSDNNKMIIKADVDETSIVKLKKGNKANIIFDAYLDTTFTGEVFQIANKPVRSTSLDNTGTVYEIKILLDLDYVNLLSGMNADVSIITNSKENVKKVPIQSIVNKDNTEGVFVARNNTAVFTPVKMGLMGKNSIEIISDKISENDLVISGPFSALKNLNDGDKIKINNKIKKTKKIKRKEKK